MNRVLLVALLWISFANSSLESERPDWAFFVPSAERANSSVPPKPDRATPWTAPYDVIADKNGEAWTAGMNSDRVVRLDPRTGQTTEYPLPKFTNIRKVYVDNSTTPVTFWAGSNHGASIMRVEPLD